MLNEKQILDLKNSLNAVRNRVRQDQNFIEVFNDVEYDKLLYIIDYVIQDIIEYAIEHEKDQWELGKEILPILIGRVMGFDVEDLAEDEAEEYANAKKFMN